MAEPPPPCRGEFGIGLDVTRGESEQVIEVDHSALELLLLVTRVDLGDCGGLDRGVAIGGGGHRCVVTGRDHARLRPFDLADDIERQGGGLAAHQACHEPDLAIEQLGRGDPALVPSLTELGVGDGVERSGVDRAAQPERADALAEFGRCLARECDRQHPTGIALALGDAPRDAAGEHTRLARAGPGEDAQCCRLCGHRGGLTGIQTRHQSTERRCDVGIDLDRWAGPWRVGLGSGFGVEEGVHICDPTPHL